MPRVFTRECAGCSNPFDTTNGRQRRCRPDCGRDRPKRLKKNPTRDATRDHHEVEFIGVDGEGDPTQPHHPYVLLSVGDRSVDNGGDMLTFDQIMDFLWECFLDNPTATYVGYFLGYDFTHWLRTLPEERARMLLSKEGKKARERTQSGDNRVPFPVEYGPWRFDILGTKRFKLQRKGDQRWMYICDVGPYFQKSFVKAIDPAAWPVPVCTPEEYATIIEGKQNRAAASLSADMIRYNVTENRVLGNLMERLNRGFVDGAEVRLKRDKWFGPGQAAQAWMKDNAREHSTEALNLAVPQAIKDAARCSYYGGWFEIFAHGPIPGETHEYDINSAYPFIIANLPCLLHGSWVHSDTIPDGDGLCLVYATVESANVLGKVRIGTMPHRTPKGNICRPTRTEGWYWRHELEAARRAGVIARINVRETYRYNPCPCPPPYRGIAELYRKRLAAGKNTPEGIALKLLYNSAYGKMAQSIGNPQFSCSVYASLITAGCRTQILDAIATHPVGVEDVVMIATDGIYFRSPHPNLDLDKERLGAWDHTIKKNMSLFKPGVYWDDKTRAAIKAGDTPVIKSRGVPGKALVEIIDAADAWWKDWPLIKIFPFVTVHLDFILTSAVQALARGKWETCGTAKTGSKVEHANPMTKRDEATVYYDRKRKMIRSYAMGPQDPMPSTPYDRRFGASDLEPEIVTPDGDYGSLLYEALGGK